MIEYILTYLAIGFVIVVTFSKPLRFKISNFRFISTFDNVPRWKVVTFAIGLTATVIVIWPFYALVVWEEWKGSRPMTEKEHEEWEMRREARRSNQDHGNRTPIRSVEPERNGIADVGSTKELP